MEQTLYKHKNISFRLLSQPAYPDTPSKDPARKYYITIKTSIMQANISSVFIIIWNPSVLEDSFN